MPSGLAAETLMISKLPPTGAAGARSTAFGTQPRGPLLPERSPSHNLTSPDSVTRQSRTAARHRREGARLARGTGAHHRQGEVQSVAHLEDDGRLRPSPPRAR